MTHKSSKRNTVKFKSEFIKKLYMNKHYTKILEKLAEQIAVIELDDIVKLYEF